MTEAGRKIKDAIDESRSKKRTVEVVLPVGTYLINAMEESSESYADHVKTPPECSRGDSVFEIWGTDWRLQVTQRPRPLPKEGPFERGQWLRGPHNERAKVIEEVNWFGYPSLRVDRGGWKSDIPLPIGETGWEAIPDKIIPYKTAGEAAYNGRGVIVEDRDGGWWSLHGRTTPAGDETWVNGDGGSMPTKNVLPNLKLRWMYNLGSGYAFWGYSEW